MHARIGGNRRKIDTEASGNVIHANGNQCTPK